MTYEESKRFKFALGLEKLNYIYISKILDYPMNLYIIVYDTRIPSRKYNYTDIQKIVNNYVRRIVSNTAIDTKIEKMRLSPVFLLENFPYPIYSGGLIFKIDLAGETYFKNEFRGKFYYL